MNGVRTYNFIGDRHRLVVVNSMELVKKDNLVRSSDWDYKPLLCNFSGHRIDNI